MDLNERPLFRHDDRRLRAAGIADRFVDDRAAELGTGVYLLERAFRGFVGTLFHRTTGLANDVVALESDVLGIRVDLNETGALEIRFEPFGHVGDLRGLGGLWCFDGFNDFLDFDGFYRFSRFRRFDRLNRFDRNDGLDASPGGARVSVTTGAGSAASTFFVSI